MKTDLYTKAVLTVIAVMLSVIAVNQFIKPVPARAASEQTHFEVGENGTLYFYRDGGSTVQAYGPLGDLSSDIHLKDR